MTSDYNLGKKATQKLSREELKEVLAVARGEAKADLLLRNVKIIDLVNGTTNLSHVVTIGKTIAGIGPEYENAEALEVIECEGKYIAPGFIDSHLHMESSLMHPFEFERAVLPLGTTTAICDPHEVTNVLGPSGFEWFLRAAEKTNLNLFVQAPSCVPALRGIETQGGVFGTHELLKYRSHPHVLGLGEMMNFPGVIFGHDEILDKLDLFDGLSKDGHGPLLSGKELNAYLAAGIQNCHETMLYEEGKEKLQKGMALMIREGTVAKNLKALAPLITEFSSLSCMLCTDDRNPAEILKEGHINHLVRSLIQDYGVPLHLAYRVSSYSAAKHFGLKRLGLIAPGMQADFILLSDPYKVDIAEVFSKGKKVSSLALAENSSQKFQESKPPRGNSMKRDLVDKKDFSLELKKGNYQVIEIIPEQIVTKKLVVACDGEKFLSDDILKIAVAERYGNHNPISLGLVKGFELKSGALASSVAHDCHNIIVIGTNDEDMEVAVNTLLIHGGGFCVVDQGDVKKVISLPIAGLMSLESAEMIAKELEFLKGAFRWQGIKMNEPFLQMAFLALPVIPTLKITDKGLFDVEQFKPCQLMY